MRCWHKDLLPYLPRLQLISQWRECCCIAKSIVEKGTPNHILVNKIMDYPMNHFVGYGVDVWIEMERRGFKCDSSLFYKYFATKDMAICDEQIFPEWHDDVYLRECLYNLEEKFRAGSIPADEWRVIYNRFKDFTPLWEGNNDDSQLN